MFPHCLRYLTIVFPLSESLIYYSMPFEDDLCTKRGGHVQSKENICIGGKICAVKANMCCKSQICSVWAEFVPWKMNLCCEKWICIKEADKCNMRHFCRSRRICDMEGRCVYYRRRRYAWKGNVCRRRRICVIKGYCSWMRIYTMNRFAIAGRYVCHRRRRYTMECECLPLEENICHKRRLFAMKADICRGSRYVYRKRRTQIYRLNHWSLLKKLLLWRVDIAITWAYKFSKYTAW